MDDLIIPAVILVGVLAFSGGSSGSDPEEEQFPQKPEPVKQHIPEQSPEAAHVPGHANIPQTPFTPFHDPVYDTPARPMTPTTVPPTKTVTQSFQALSNSLEEVETKVLELLKNSNTILLHRDLTVKGDLNNIRKQIQENEVFLGTELAGILPSIKKQAIELPIPKVDEAAFQKVQHCLDRIQTAEYNKTRLERVQQRLQTEFSIDPTHNNRELDDPSLFDSQIKHTIPKAPESSEDFTTIKQGTLDVKTDLNKKFESISEEVESFELTPVRSAPKKSPVERLRGLITPSPKTPPTRPPPRRSAVQIVNTKPPTPIQEINPPTGNLTPEVLDELGARLKTGLYAGITDLDEETLMDAKIFQTRVTLLIGLAKSYELISQDEYDLAKNYRKDPGSLDPNQKESLNTALVNAVRTFKYALERRNEKDT